MTSKLILLNGPKGCGKTDAVKAMKTLFPNIVDRRCKDRLHEITMQLFNVPEEIYWDIYEDRVRKETPNTLFMIEPEEAVKLIDIIGPLKYKGDAIDGQGYKVVLTIREAMIFVSECIVKPIFGDDYFGVARADVIQENEIAVDDSVGGWTDEITPAIEKLGAENILLIRIYGRGDYEGDSRSYLPDGILLAENTKEVYNVGTLNDFLDAINFIVTDFLLEDK